jgi:hypothetical protein
VSRGPEGIESIGAAAAAAASGVDEASAAEVESGWDRPIPHWSTDAFAARTTLHGLASDEARSALHKHVRKGRVEEAIAIAVELARTDSEHETMLWSRLQILAAEDVGMGSPQAPAIVRALREGSLDADPGSYDRLVFAAQAAGYLARAPKDPVNVEIMQTQMLTDVVPTIPDDAICVHTRAGQERGETMYTWFLGTLETAPEAPDRDLSYRDALVDLYLELDPPPG